MESRDGQVPRREHNAGVAEDRDRLNDIGALSRVE